MTTFLRRTPAILGLLALGAAGALLVQGAHAEDGPAARKAAAAVFDVRVVRVDPADSAVVEVAPPWQPAGAAGATANVAWADLLAGLKSRGRAAILLDQRLTALSGVATDFKQERRRPVLALRSRSDKSEVWETTYTETGTTGRLLATQDGLEYDVFVRWEEPTTSDGMPALAGASWKGSHPDLAAGETLVLSYRQQQATGAAALQGLEIYVFVTRRAVPSR